MDRAALLLASLLLGACHRAADTLPVDRPALSAQVDSSRRTALVVAVQRVAPAVVSLSVVSRQRVQPRSLWEELFLPPGLEQEVMGLGSGVVVRADGVVLTNEHVVRGAERIAATLPDGRTYPATIVGTDPVNDVAVLRLERPRGDRAVPVAPLGTARDLLIGEWALAIGNPVGFLLANTEPSVSVGVVSAVRRNLVPASTDGRGVYLGMIQTDASINPGNSGGPLVNVRGEVIGINTSIISASGGSEGLGFAIPIDRARRIAEDLLATGRVRRAWVGLEVEAAPSVDGRLGVRVARVVPGSPADRAGLRPGVFLDAVEGLPLHHPLDWTAWLLEAEVGRPFRVAIREDGARRTVALTPTDLPSLRAERVRALQDFELVTVTPAIRAERGLRTPVGALIVGLSEAARALGLREGDVIVQINGVPIRSAEEAAQVLQRLAGRAPVVLVFERGGQLGAVQFWVD
jgi:serine protease Do